MADKPLDREALLALTPERYLAGGFRDAQGEPHPELLGEWATAAAMRLRRAGVSPVELSATYEALRLTLPLHEGEAAEVFERARAEAMDIVRRMQFGQANHSAVAAWLAGCAPAVKNEADLEALLAHFQAVVRQIAVIDALTGGDQ